MIDDASHQRGIEDYVAQKPTKYPIHFYKRCVANPVKTAALREQAKAKGENPDLIADVYDDIDYARIPQIGARDDCFDNPVNEDIIHHYSQEWQRYQAGIEHQEGVPLDQWGGLPQDMKLRLQLLNIYTVEQFINMPTPMYNQVAPDMARFIAEAKRFLGQKYSNARQEVEDKKEQRIAELEAKLEALVTAQSDIQKPENKESRRR